MMTGVDRLFSFPTAVTRDKESKVFMPPFLQLLALAAIRRDGLRPELRILFERLIEASQAASNFSIAIADDEHRMNIISVPSVIGLTETPLRSAPPILRLETRPK
jgi:hypothetical protein